jgi:hypothetical protein
MSRAIRMVGEDPMQMVGRVGVAAHLLVKHVRETDWVLVEIP